MLDKVDSFIDDLVDYGPNSVIVNVPIVSYQSIQLPAKNSEKSLKAIFLRLTVEDELEISRYAFLLKNNEINIDVSGLDFNLYQYLLLRRCLVSIDDCSYERQNGWVVKKDWEKVIRMNGMLLMAVISKYQEEIALSEAESGLLERQASIIFNSENGKVMNPVPGLSMYCAISALWDKLGISKDDIKNMRHDDYIRIRAILAKESESIRRESKK